jgi:hypothetical protein
MRVRFFKSKDDTCSELECIMLEIRHLHARCHSFGASAHVLEFDRDSVFEASKTCKICARLGVGVQFWAPYAQHVLGKAKRPWRTLRDNASTKLHRMFRKIPCGRAL